MLSLRMLMNSLSQLWTWAQLTSSFLRLQPSSWPKMARKEGSITSTMKSPCRQDIWTIDRMKKNEMYIIPWCEMKLISLRFNWQHMNMISKIRPNQSPPHIHYIILPLHSASLQYIYYEIWIRLIVKSYLVFGDDLPSVYHVVVPCLDGLTGSVDDEATTQDVEIPVHEAQLISLEKLLQTSSSTENLQVLIFTF